MPSTHADPAAKSRVATSEDAMSAEVNEALIRRLYDQVFSQWNLSVIDECVGSELVGHDMPPGTPRGLAGFKQFYTSISLPGSAIHSRRHDCRR
jgi:hypothetical protein